MAGNGKESTMDESLAIRLQKLEDRVSGLGKGGNNNTGDDANDYIAIRRKQHANPAPLGLFAFGFCTALLQGATTKWTEPSTNSYVFGFALAYGGLAQLLAGMWEFPRGNMFGSVAFTSYGAFWIGWAIYEILATYHASTTTQATKVNGVSVTDPTTITTTTGVVPSGVKGSEMMLSLWGIFTFLLFLQTFTMNTCLQALFLCLAITFWLLAAGVQHPNAKKAGGYFGILTAGIAWYTGFAELTNECYKRTILPLGHWSAPRIPVPPLVRSPTNLV